MTANKNPCSTSGVKSTCVADMNAHGQMAYTDRTESVLLSPVFRRRRRTSANPTAMIRNSEAIFSISRRVIMDQDYTPAVQGAYGEGNGLMVAGVELHFQ